MPCPLTSSCCCAASSAAPVISSAPCWRHPACAGRVTVIWTRHRRPPDLTPRVGAWFTAAGFDELAFDALDTGPLSAVGAEPAAPCSIGSTARPAAVHLPGLSRPRSVGQDRRKERGLDG